MQLINQFHEAVDMNPVLWMYGGTPDVDLHRELLDRVDGRCGGPGICWWCGLRIHMVVKHKICMGKPYCMHWASMSLENTKRRQKWSWDVLAIHFELRESQDIPPKVWTSEAPLVFDARGSLPYWTPQGENPAGYGRCSTLHCQRVVLSAAPHVGNGSWGRTQNKLGFDTKKDRFLINKNVM